MDPEPLELGVRGTQFPIHESILTRFDSLSNSLLTASGRILHVATVNWRGPFRAAPLAGLGDFRVRFPSALVQMKIFQDEGYEGGVSWLHVALRDGSFWRLGLQELLDLGLKDPANNNLNATNPKRPRGGEPVVRSLKKVKTVDSADTMFSGPPSFAGARDNQGHFSTKIFEALQWWKRFQDTTPAQFIVPLSVSEVLLVKSSPPVLTILKIATQDPSVSTDVRSVKCPIQAPVTVAEFATPSLSPELHAALFSASRTMTKHRILLLGTVDGRVYSIDFDSDEAQEFRVLATLNEPVVAIQGVYSAAQLTSAGSCPGLAFVGERGTVMVAFLRTDGNKSKILAMRKLLAPGPLRSLSPIKNGFLALGASRKLEILLFNHEKPEVFAPTSVSEHPVRLLSGGLLAYTKLEESAKDSKVRVAMVGPRGTLHAISISLGSPPSSDSSASPNTRPAAVKKEIKDRLLEIARTNANQKHLILKKEGLERDISFLSEGIEVMGILSRGSLLVDCVVVPQLTSLNGIVTQLAIGFTLSNRSQIRIPATWRVATRIISGNNQVPLSQQVFVPADLNPGQSWSGHLLLNPTALQLPCHLQIFFLFATSQGGIALPLHQHRFDALHFVQPVPQTPPLLSSRSPGSQVPNLAKFLQSLQAERLGPLSSQRGAIQRLPPRSHFAVKVAKLLVRGSGTVGGLQFWLPRLLPALLSHGVNSEAELKKLIRSPAKAVLALPGRTGRGITLDIAEIPVPLSSLSNLELAVSGEMLADVVEAREAVLDRMARLKGVSSHNLSGDAVVEFAKEIDRDLVLAVGELQRCQVEILQAEQEFQELEQFSSWRNTRSLLAHTKSVEELGHRVSQLYLKARGLGGLSLTKILDA